MTVSAQHAVQHVQMEASGQHSKLKINSHPADPLQSDKQELHTVTWPARPSPPHKHTDQQRRRRRRMRKGPMQKKRPQRGSRAKAINSHGVRRAHGLTDTHQHDHSSWLSKQQQWLTYWQLTCRYNNNNNITTILYRAFQSCISKRFTKI